jgi:DNA-directed RNA polymerase subunit L
MRDYCLKRARKGLMNAQIETLKKVIAHTPDERARMNLARDVALALRSQKHTISEIAFSRVKIRSKSYPSQVVLRALNTALEKGQAKKSLGAKALDKYLKAEQPTIFHLVEAKEKLLELLEALEDTKN